MNCYVCETQRGEARAASYELVTDTKYEGIEWTMPLCAGHAGAGLLAKESGVIAGLEPSHGTHNTRVRPYPPEVLHGE